MAAISLVLSFGQKNARAFALFAALNPQRRFDVFIDIVKRHPHDRILQVRVAIAKRPAAFSAELPRIQDNATSCIRRLELLPIRDRAQQIRNLINNSLKTRRILLQNMNLSVERLVGLNIQPLPQFVNQIGKIAGPSLRE